MHSEGSYIVLSELAAQKLLALPIIVPISRKKGSVIELGLQWHFIGTDRVDLDA